MTFRLIDDVLSSDNPHISEAVQVCSENGGMYPSELTLNTTSVSPKEADFLGVRILADTRRFRISVFDKRKSFTDKCYNLIGNAVNQLINII